MNETEFPGLSRRNWLQAAVLAASLPTVAWGKIVPPPPADDDDEDAEIDDKKYQTKIDTEFVGDKTNFSGLEPVLLEGVGLVRNLPGTGGDPAPSMYRTALMEELKREGWKAPQSIIASPTTALVIVRAQLTPMNRKGDYIDVKIHTPDGADATSLVGGELMDVRLSDRAMINGEYKTGRVYAIARGPVLTDGLASASNTEPGLLLRGRVLGGAKVIKERELSLTLKNDFRSVRNAQRIATAIGRRFHHFDEHGSKKPLATAKTDQRLVLTVHPAYKNDFPRYLEVIRHVAFKEDPVQLRIRMTRLQHDLMIPKTSFSSSLQLEAIGNDAIPMLKKGIASPLIECRFYAAVALAFLGESAGIPTLVEAAKNERAFRVFALGALGNLEDAEAHLALRELMSEPVDETRYGAFRSLWTLDKSDHFIRGERMGIREDVESHDNEYFMHVLQTSGPPLAHVTLRTRPEVVLFGAEQEFSAPMVLAAGKHILVKAQPGATTVSLARFEAGKPDERKEVSMKVADVIRAANELGATYPDVVQMLTDASKQKNLAAPLGIDKLPEAQRVYHRPQTDQSKGGIRDKVKIGRPRFVPGSFPESDDPAEAQRRRSEEARDADSERTDGTQANIPAEKPPAQRSPEPAQTPNKKPGGSGKNGKSSWSSWFGGSK